ncbi:MAG: 4Fe-4S binding protein [Myxococcota bacterium]|jgi:NADH-quinone oxidoreductase subunit I|nr:4Fe-4S binding protein [Myxococcota bacterium]
MSTLMSTFEALGLTMRNVFRKKTTEPLPWKGERARSERYRASFALVHDEHDEEACIGCKMCEKICPSEIITVIPAGRKRSEATGKPRGWAEDFVLDLNACIICELCVQVCPADAIVMLRVQEEPGFSREALVLTMDRLYANEKLAQATWATGTRLIEMQAPPKKAKKPKKAKPPKDETAGKAAEPAAASSPATEPSATPSPATEPSATPSPATEPAPDSTPAQSEPEGEAVPVPEPVSEPAPAVDSASDASPEVETENKE